MFILFEKRKKEGHAKCILSENVLFSVNELGKSLYLSVKLALSKFYSLATADICSFSVLIPNSTFYFGESLPLNCDNLDRVVNLGAYPTVQNPRGVP